MANDGGGAVSDARLLKLEQALESKLASLRSLVIICAVVLFVLLSGLLSGMVYGMVMLIPPRVSQSTGALLFNPRGGAALSGGAVVDLTGGFQNASHYTLFATDSMGASLRSARRARALLQAANSTNSSSGVLKVRGAARSALLWAPLGGAWLPIIIRCDRRSRPSSRC